MPLYRPLTHHLISARRRGETRIELTFDELENVLGFTLAPYARTEKSFWCDDPRNYHAWTQAYKQAGWGLESVTCAKGKDAKKGKIAFIAEGKPTPRALIIMGLEKVMQIFRMHIEPSLARADTHLGKILRPHVTRLSDTLTPPLQKLFKQAIQAQQKLAALLKQYVRPHYERALDVFFENADRLLDRLQAWLKTLRNQNK